MSTTEQPEPTEEEQAIPVEQPDQDDQPELPDRDVNPGLGEYEAEPGDNPGAAP